MTSLMHDYWDDDVRMELRQPAPGAFYPHPYGGIARDIPVTREGFKRIFEWTDYEMDHAEREMGKVIDRFHDNAEVIGYVGHCFGKRHFTVTVINRTHGALMDHAIRSTVQNPAS